MNLVKFKDVVNVLSKLMNPSNLTKGSLTNSSDPDLTATRGAVRSVPSLIFSLPWVKDFQDYS